MGKIAGILQAKGGMVHTIDASSTVFEAIRKMTDSNVGSLLVLDGETVCGIITERDYLRRIALEGRTSRATLVRDSMTEKVICSSPEADVEECMALMTEKRIRHLPIVEEGHLAGIVSIGDLVKELVKEQKYQIAYLTDYITGKYPA
jgi:CBS domain-containing protein